MRFVAVKGNNFKNYVQLILEDKKDLEYLEIIRSIVTRKEYKAYSQNPFNKWVTESYLINETFIPAQLYQDVYKKMKAIIPNIKLENDAFLYNDGLKKDDVEFYAETLNLPPKYDLFADAYFYQLESVYRALLFKQARLEIGTGGG